MLTACRELDSTYHWWNSWGFTVSWVLWWGCGQTFRSAWERREIWRTDSKAVDKWRAGYSVCSVGVAMPLCWIGHNLDWDRHNRSGCGCRQLMRIPNLLRPYSMAFLISSWVPITGRSASDLTTFEDYAKTTSHFQKHISKWCMFAL